MTTSLLQIKIEARESDIITPIATGLVCVATVLAAYGTVRIILDTVERFKNVVQILLGSNTTKSQEQPPAQHPLKNKVSIQNPEQPNRELLSLSSLIRTGEQIDQPIILSPARPLPIRANYTVPNPNYQK